MVSFRAYGRDLLFFTFYFLISSFYFLIFNFNVSSMNLYYSDFHPDFNFRFSLYF